MGHNDLLMSRFEPCHVPSPFLNFLEPFPYSFRGPGRLSRHGFGLKPASVKCTNIGVSFLRRSLRKVGNDDCVRSEWSVMPYSVSMKSVHMCSCISRSSSSRSGCCLVVVVVVVVSSSSSSIPHFWAELRVVVESRRGKSQLFSRQA
jgi:hypothetical protein